MAKIDSVERRGRLKAQNEPHWVRLAAGCYLGFRKLTPASSGTWIARHRDPETGKRTKKSLGDLGHLPMARRYDAAKVEAESWFRHLGMGGSSEAVSVKLACKQYVEHVRDARGDRAADDIEARFERWVYDSELGQADLGKLSRVRVESWRKLLSKTPARVNRGSSKPVTRPRSQSTVNRDMTALRAALNRAHDAGQVCAAPGFRSTSI